MKKQLPSRVFSFDNMEQLILDKTTKGAKYLDQDLLNHLFMSEKKETSPEPKLQKKRFESIVDIYADKYQIDYYKGQKRENPLKKNKSTTSKKDSIAKLFWSVGGTNMDMLSKDLGFTVA